MEITNPPQVQLEINEIFGAMKRREQAPEAIEKRIQDTKRKAIEENAS